MEAFDIAWGIVTHPAVKAQTTTIIVGTCISLFLHEFGHFRAACRSGLPPKRMSLGWPTFGFGWSGNGIGWGFGRGYQPHIDPDPRLYDNVSAVRKVAVAGPLGSGLALILVLITTAAICGVIHTWDLSLPWAAPQEWLAQRPVVYGLLCGLAACGVVNVLSIIRNLIPTGKTADELSDGMFIFRTEQAIAMKKQALRDQANQRSE